MNAVICWIGTDVMKLDLKKERKKIHHNPYKYTAVKEYM